MKHASAIAIALLLCACQKNGEETGNSGEKHENPGYVGTLDKLGIPHRTISEKMRQPDLADWPKDGAANGLTVQRITGAKAGLDRGSVPYAKFVTTEQVKGIDFTRQGTGLYIVDTDYVPRDLPELLRLKGFTPRPDGSLADANGEPVALLIKSETYLAKGPMRTSFLDRASELLSAPAQAASPFPWRCFSFGPWAVYHGGFHRWYEAGTNIAAYGADGSGGCSSGSPLTRIDFLQARAAVGWPGTVHFCFNCPTMSAYDTWDVGYFWPAHGTPVTTHSGIWADGNFSFSRTANLTW